MAQHDEASEDRSVVSFEHIQKNLVDDTNNMNRIFWGEAESITNEKINIINVGVNSRISCFNKITMEGAKRVKEMIGFDAVDTIASNDDIPEWTFNATTGLEIDESLHWDGINRTGSYLTTVI